MDIIKYSTFIEMLSNLKSQKWEKFYGKYKKHALVINWANKVF